MRTLGTVANAARQLRSYGGTLVCLKIEFPAPVGDIYFTSNWEPPDVATSQLRQVVTDWGSVTSSLGESATFPQSIGNLVLADVDGELRGIWEDLIFQRLAFELYWTVWTPGEALPGISASTSILRGSINPPVAWTEFDLSIAVSLTDYALRRADIIGLRTTKEDYPDIWIEDEGRIIPIVYGRPRGVHAISKNGGPIARLMQVIDDDDASFLVDDASGFPQGSPIVLGIDREHIAGSFDGNVFTVTARAAVLTTGTTTTTPAEYAIAIDTNKIGVDDNLYAGYIFRPTEALDDSTFLRLAGFDMMIGNVMPSYMSSGGDQSREIIRFDGASGKFEFARSFIMETEISYIAGGIVADSNFQLSGQEIAIRAGVDYTIDTRAAAHNEGAEVYLIDEPSEYIVGRGSLAVEAVYVHGKRKQSNVLYQQAFGTNVWGNLTDIAVEEQHRYLDGGSVEDEWIPVRPEYYEVVNENHPTTGDPLTVVKLVRRPRELPGYVLTGDDVLVDLKNTIRNPADIMEDICNTYGGMSVDFSSVANDLTNWHMDFINDDETSVRDLLSDLAFQSRCALRWTGQDPELIYQYANGGIPVIALDRSNILTDMTHNSTFGMFRDDVDAAYSQVTVNWLSQGHLIGTTHEQSHTERNASVESAIGRRDFRVDCWAYNSEDGPKALALYLLERHQSLYRMIETDVTVYGIAIEPGDIVSVTHPALPYTPEPGQVISITNTVGRNPETADAIHLVLRQFIWPGCGVTGCQGFCESSPCETGACQVNWQPATCFKCETNDQTICNILGCQNAAQNLCAQTTCQVAATNGCFAFCMPTTMNFGCGYCETMDCETANCQTTGCQTTNCQTTNCQTTACQTGVE